MKIITDETVPCWYELSFKGANEQPGLLLRLHSEFVAHHPSVFPNRECTIRLLQTYFEFQKFQGSFGADFGFPEGALKCLGFAPDGFLEYSIPMSMCRMRGRKYDRDYRAAYAVSANLTTLFQFLQCYRVETTSKLPQLLIVETMTGEGNEQSGLSGEYSNELVSYLRSNCLDKTEIPEMLAAMRTVWTTMEQQPPTESTLEAHVQDSSGWLSVGCLGWNGTCLHPRYSRTNAGLGYEFSSHNVDNPVQQLTLLAALAALHDLARAAPAQ